MAREEILNVLKELQDMNTNELEDLNISKKIVENEIAKLEEKISDNSNYPVFDYINTKSKINNIDRALTSLSERMDSNDSIVDNENTSVELLDSEIEKLNAQISETQQQLDDIGRKLRSLGENPDKDLEEEYSKLLQEKRENLTNLNDELEACEENKKSSLDSVEKLKDSNRQLAELINRYDKLKENLNESEKNKEGYDKSKKGLDESRLVELKSSLDAINSRNNYINSTVISEVINDIENNNISDEEINNRLLELKDNMPSDYIENSSDIIEKIKEKQDNLTMLISDLQTKLSDEVNYTPSIFATEVYSDEISDYESRIKAYDNEMSNKDLYISRLEKVIDGVNNNITIRESKIIELQSRIDYLRFEMTDSSYSKQDLDSFTKEISKNKKEIENIRKQIERLNKNISTKETLISSLKKDRKEVENIKNADLKTLEGLRTTLDDRKTLDRVSIANDKKQLEVYLSERKLLESLERFYGVEFDKLNIDIKSNNLENNEVEPIVETKEIEKSVSIKDNIEESVEVKENDASINPEENIEVVENTSVEDAISEENNLENSENIETSENVETSKDLESSLANNLYHVDKLEDIEEPTFQMPEASSLASDIDSSVINSVEPEAPILEKDEKEKVVGYNPASNSLVEKSRNTKFISKIKEKLSAIRFSLAVGAVSVKKFVSELKNDIHTSIKNAKNNEPNSFVDTVLNSNENLKPKEDLKVDEKKSEKIDEPSNTVDKEDVVSESNLMEELDSYTPDENETGLNNNIEYEPADSVTIGEDGAEEDLFIRNLQHKLFGNEEPSMGRSR